MAAVNAPAEKQYRYTVGIKVNRSGAEYDVRVEAVSPNQAMKQAKIDVERILELKVGTYQIIRCECVA